MGAGKRSPSVRSKDFVKILRLLAGLAALILTASATSATVIDLRAALGPSGHYTSRAYYRSLLGGQPMTAAQQAYADQEDHLRLLGFLSESGGDFALGQIFYRIAYGIIPPSPGLDLAGGGSTGGSDLGSASSGLVAFTNPDVGPAIAAPEASTWVMMAIGFMGLGFTGWRARQKTGAGPLLRRVRGYHQGCQLRPQRQQSQ